MLLVGLIEIPTWILLSIAVGVLCYIYSCHNYYSFKGTGIPSPYRLPLVGYLTPQAVKLGLYNYDTYMKRTYGKLIGLSGKQPSLIVFDEDMIAQIMVKQFSNFTNRRAFTMDDEINDNFMTVLKDEHWKRVRSAVSPTFTTGRLKWMAGELNRCAQILTESIMSKGPIFEARDVCGRYTMDVIASTAFGLRVNSQNESDNDFYMHGKNIMDSVGLTNPKLLLFILVPGFAKLATKFGMTVFDAKSKNFFITVSKQTLNSRTEGDKTRYDFIQLMANARREEILLEKKAKEENVKKPDTTSSTRFDLSDNEILGNAFLFFIAGFDTTYTGLSMALYNLALNPECQQKAFEEIEAIVGEQSDINYESVMKMTYLEQCLHESLRIHSPVFRVDRVAKQDMVINGVTIKKDMVVEIPVYAIHHDPEIWEEPEKFDPERFTQENKAKRSPFAWLAFGSGPRNCIAQRLAIYEMKVALVHILRKNRIFKCDKTEIPMTYKTGQWMKAKNGVWLGSEKRA